MKNQNFQIGKPLMLTVYWYDNIPEPRRHEEHEGEIIGWRDTQVIIRVKDYAVIRFWKRSGLEVGNQAHPIRGFRVDLSELAATVKPNPGVDIPIDTDA